MERAGLDAGPAPLGIDLRHAALIEPVAVAVHDVRRGGVCAGDRVVVLGGGPIGTLIAGVASRHGAEVAVVEPDDRRRAMVERLGVLAPDPAATDLVAWVEEWTRAAGADVVFEVSGAAAAVALSTSLAKVRGTVVVVAIHAQPRPVNLHRVFWRELTVVGARVYERHDFGPRWTWWRAVRSRPMPSSLAWPPSGRSARPSTSCRAGAR